MKHAMGFAAVRTVALFGMFTLIVSTAASAHAELDERVRASLHSAALLESDVNWGDTRLLAIQDRGRYKPLEAFARELKGALKRKNA